MAQIPAPESPSPTSDTEENEVDEIIVTGKKTLQQIRREIRAIDNQIYSIFNELNTDDDYDIVCRKMSRIGSQIVRTNCKAKLYWDSVSKLAEETDDALSTPRPLSNTQQHTAEFRAKLAEFADSNDALRRALVQRKLLADEERALLGDRD